MFQIQANYREKVCQFYINEISWNCLDGRRPCGDPTTMFLPYVRNRVHTYFVFFSSFIEGPVFNEHCILIAIITVCQFIQNKTFGLSTMICPTEKSAHIYLLALRLVWYPANIDWRMTGRCHMKATPSDTNHAYNEWTSYFYIDRWFALRRSALRDSLNGFVSIGVEREGKGRKRNRNESQETEEINISPLPLPATRTVGHAQL